MVRGERRLPPNAGLHPFCPNLEGGVMQLAPTWRVRSKVGRLRMPVLDEDSAFVGTTEVRTTVYDVEKPGEAHRCRTRPYATHLRWHLLYGGTRSAVLSEKEFLIRRSRGIACYRCAGTLNEYVAIHSSGMILMRLASSVDKEAFELTLAQRAALRDKPRAGRYDAYIAAREAERLDKPVSDRVYEILKRLTKDRWPDDDADPQGELT